MKIIAILSILTYIPTVAAVSVALDFENGTWAGDADAGASGGWLDGARNGSLTSNGVTVTASFGNGGGGTITSFAPSFVDNAQVEGFTLGSGSSENVDQNGSSLVNHVFMDITFSEPSWVVSWTMGDLDAFWQTPDDREWVDEIHVEGWAGNTFGSIGSGIQSVWSDLGVEVVDTTVAGVAGVRSTFTTNAAPANDPRNQATFSLGSESEPIQSLRLYFVSAGNTNVTTGHNVVIQESLPNIQSVPEPSSALLLSLAFLGVASRRKR